MDATTASTACAPGFGGYSQAGWQSQLHRAPIECQEETHHPRKHWVFSSLGWMTMTMILAAKMYIIILKNCPKMHVFQVKESIHYFEKIMYLI